MTSGISKIKSVESQEQFCSKTKNKLTLFSVIATKPVDILFEKTIDNIKEVNRKDVFP